EVLEPVDDLRVLDVGLARVVVGERDRAERSPVDRRRDPLGPGALGWSGDGMTAGRRAVLVEQLDRALRPDVQLDDATHLLEDLVERCARRDELEDPSLLVRERLARSEERRVGKGGARRWWWMSE